MLMFLVPQRSCVALSHLSRQGGAHLQKMMAGSKHAAPGRQVMLPRTGCARDRQDVRPGGSPCKGVLRATLKLQRHRQPVQ